MGVCQSCLGRGDKDDYDEVRERPGGADTRTRGHGAALAADDRGQSEETRLLYEDGLQYGSFGDPTMGGDETIEGQRESEALQRVLAKTSKSVRPQGELGEKGEGGLAGHEVR